MDDNKNEIEKLIEGANQSIAERKQDIENQESLSASASESIEEIVDPALVEFAKSVMEKRGSVNTGVTARGTIHFSPQSGYNKTNLIFTAQNGLIAISTVTGRLKRDHLGAPLVPFEIGGLESGVFA